MEALIKKIPKQNYHKNIPVHYTDYKNKDCYYFNFISSDIDFSNQEKVIRSIAPLKDEVLLDINDKQYRLSYHLKHIVAQIEEAKEILQYGFDWDDEGALPTKAYTFKKAASFVVDYAVYIFKHHHVVLKTPYIDILKDGSVSVHWETKEAQFLIIFKKENPRLAYYYAERKDNKVPFKSAVEPDKPVDEFLALWMKMNLT